MDFPEMTIYTIEVPPNNCQKSYCPIINAFFTGFLVIII